MASIFFSYRKQGEDKASSLRLADDFRSALGEESVFRDEKGLRPGRFKDQLHDKLQNCKVMIAVIGPTWIERIPDLRDANDWVRRELEVGLERAIQMTPVLVDGVRQPKPSELPTSLADLFEYQFIRVHAKHWRTDVNELIDFFAEYLGIDRIDTQQQKPLARIDLSGTWYSTEGETIRLAHQGGQLQLLLYNNYGQTIGQGTGTIDEDQIQFSVQRSDIGFGNGQGRISSDGRTISGIVQYGMERYSFSISRY